MTKNKYIAPEKMGKIHRRKFEYAFKKKKKVEKDVIVCEAEADCVIQATKPIFVHETNNPDHCIVVEGDDDDLSCIGIKDIKDLSLATKLVCHVPAGVI